MTGQLQFEYMLLKTSSGCWEWLGTIMNSGYGQARYQGHQYLAHRVAAFYAGMIAHPKCQSRKLCVLHKCDNKSCCNPNHLEIGDLSKNQRDAYNRGLRAQPKGAEHANAKLTMRQVRAIRANLKGLGARLLAAKYGVSRAAIRHIQQGHTYVCA